MNRLRFGRRRLSYVPRVTREDVLRLVRRDFPHEPEEEVLQLLDEYGREVWHREAARVHLAALKLSPGSLDGLRRSVETAKLDYRDVLAPAEYPEEDQLGFAEMGRLDEAARDEVRERDRRQYEAWLRSASRP